MALPFELPVVSGGFAALTPAAGVLGREAAAVAARALGLLTGAPVEIRGRALPGPPTAGPGTIPLRIDLPALPGTAAFEVDGSLAVALLDLLSGGPGDGDPAGALTPLELASLELAALACLDAVAALPPVAERLAPHLSRLEGQPRDALAVELSVRLGACTGRARLLLPRAAVIALGAPADLGAPLAIAALQLSVRGEWAPIDPRELCGLEAGDVVLVDPPPAGRLSAVAPGGARLRGTAAGGAFTVEEVIVAQPQSGFPVALEVELARVPITLGELARLGPGAVLPLHIDRRGQVALKLGERTIARGALVDLEGAIGVRIDELGETGP